MAFGFSCRQIHHIPGRPLDGTDRQGRNPEELRLTGVDQPSELAFQAAVELRIADDWVIVTQDPADVRLGYSGRLRHGSGAEAKHPANRSQPADIGVFPGPLPVRAGIMPCNGICGDLWGI